MSLAPSVGMDATRKDRRSVIAAVCAASLPHAYKASSPPDAGDAGTSKQTEIGSFPASSYHLKAGAAPSRPANVRAGGVAVMEPPGEMRRVVHAE